MVKLMSEAEKKEIKKGKGWFKLLEKGTK